MSKVFEPWEYSEHYVLEPGHMIVWEPHVTHLIERLDYLILRTKYYEENKGMIEELQLLHKMATAIVRTNQGAG